MIRLQVPQDVDAREHAYALAGEIGQRAHAYVNATYSHGRVPLREFEAARVRIAQINGCQACLAARVTTIASVGAAHGNGANITESLYQAVGDPQRADELTHRESLAVQLAERFARDHLSLADDDEFWVRLHAAFSDEEVVELLLSAGAFTAMGRFHRILGLDYVCEIHPSPAGRA